MRFITCFGAVADDAGTAARARSMIQKQRWNLASSFRRKLLSSGGKGSKKTKKPSSHANEKASHSDAEYPLYGGASASSSPAPSSPPLSSTSHY
jgi:hypothetical protein